jgi:hypothetical protein
MWLRGWNEHGLSSERNLSPKAMWAAGLRILQQQSNLIGSSEPELDQVWNKSITLTSIQILFRFPNQGHVASGERRSTND